MNGFQRFVMEMIGLNPYFYRPRDASRRWNAVRDMNDTEIKWVDDAFNSECDDPNSGVSKYLERNNHRKVTISEFIVHLIRTCK